MDGTLAIEHNRQALQRILAALVAMAAGGATLPRHLHRAILRLLRPAEAAARRLIIAAARGLVVTVPPSRSRKPEPTPTILRNGVGTGILMPPALPAPAASASAHPRALPLLDPLRGPTRRRWVSRIAIPRIGVPGHTERAGITVRPAPSPDDPMAAARLVRRFEALASALGDFPRQATRFARWRARRDRALGAGKVHRLWPLRMGRPPGCRSRPVHEVDDVLSHANRLALWALEARDTS